MTQIQKDLHEERSRRLANGQCPVCGESKGFEQTGTRDMGGYRVRSMRCRHCNSTFQTVVRTIITFCKVTREGSAVQPSEEWDK